MDLSELLEDDTKDLVIIYPGRFHPFHIGHGKVYKYLKQKYSNAKVFISTSGKVDGDRSPFTFEEKKKMMVLAGVDSGAIVQCKSPYQSIEIVQQFDENKTVVVFAVSEKDMAEEPRFDFSDGIKLKKNGEPAYMQKWSGLDSAETYREHGYIATTPTFPFEVLGQKINSASQIRNMIVASDDTKLTQMLQDLYNITDVPQDIIEIFKRKIGNKETMNENWSECSLSEFLIEIEHEEKKMKTSILKSITEGVESVTTDKDDKLASLKISEPSESSYSDKQIKMAFGILNDPRYKGGNYSGAVAAIEKLAKGLSNHPSVANALKRANESIDEEFDRRVKEVVESKIKEANIDRFTTRDYINRVKSIAADIKDYVDDHKEHFDAYPTDVEISDKLYDWDEYWAILDKAYPGEYPKFESVNESKDYNLIAQRKTMNLSNQAIIALVASLYKQLDDKELSEVKVDEWVQDQDAGNWSMWTAQERSFIQELCLRHDGIKMDPAGLKYLGKSELWDEGSILKDKGKLTTLMLWVKKNKDDIEGRFTRMFKVYSKDNNNGQSDGNQVLQNIIGKISKVDGVTESKSKVTEASIHDLPQKIKDWLSNYPAGEGEYAFAKGIPNTEANNKIINSIAKIVPIRRRYRATSKPGYDRPRQYAHKDHADTIALYVKEKVEEGSYANEQHEQLEYIHHVLQECGGGNVDTAMVDQAIEFVEDIREQHFNADGSTKSESIDESQGYQDLGNIVGYLDTIDEYVEMLFKSAKDKKETEIAYRIQNAVDDIRTRELGLKPSNIRDRFNEDDMNYDISQAGSRVALDWASIDGRLYDDILQAFEDEHGEGYYGDWVITANKEGGVEESLENVEEATHDEAKPIYDLVGDLGAGDKPLADVDGIFHDLVRYLDGDTIKNFVADFRRNNDLNYPGEDGDYGEDDKNFESVDKELKEGKYRGYDVEVRFIKDAHPFTVPALRITGPDLEDIKYQIDRWLDESIEEGVNQDQSSESIEQMQDAYKYNEERNNHSENILMLAQMFGDRGEIRAVEGLLKVIKRQGHVTPDQSEMMYNAIHKKYYSQLFPTENEGNEFSGELAKAKIDGKKEFKVDDKTYKVKEALTKLIDKQKFVEGNILHYSDAKGTPKYSEGYKAAKDGVKYDENPYSGAEKLQWSKGHNDFRADKLRAAGEPNYGARGQFESKK